MRDATDRSKIESFMKALGREARIPGRIYLTGGACAVLFGWRSQTMDIDIKMQPDQDLVFRAIAELKEKLNINVELASPGDFIPELPEWESRSLFIVQNGKLDFLHYDFYAQALSKIERSHAHDQEDVRHMLARGLVEKPKLLQFMNEIEPNLYRYPAIKPAAFRRKVEKFVKE
jgi:hypothetical protein